MSNDAPSNIPVSTVGLPGAASSPDTTSGEMANRIRHFDWSGAGLGIFDRWPDTLKAAVTLMLSNRSPAVIWWGVDLASIYNDACVQPLGPRHPTALGQSARLVWSDLWNKLGQELGSVMQSGQTVWSDSTRIVQDRNGFIEETWFTWNFTPLRNETGAILGVQGVWLEDTSRVLKERSRERALDERMKVEFESGARSILSSITDAFFSLDREWRFTYLNPPCFVLLGRGPEELVGKVIWDEYPISGTAFERVYRNAGLPLLKAGAVVEYFPFHKCWYDVRAYPARDGVSVFFRDVTKEKEAEVERERLLDSERTARTEAERAGRLKDEFLATLSHEIRTPLNAMLGWCEILKSVESTVPDIVEGVATIERNARAQGQIIADILDMSSLMAGKIRMRMRRTDLAAVVAGALATARPAAEAKGVILQASLAAGLPEIAGDPDRLQQVFWNLLTNSIKFTPQKGKIVVSLDRVESHLEVRVVDTGIGINSDFLPFVFDRFRQADASTTRRYGGLGLGLSIVKQLVELHGGKITAESAGPNQGASFVVILPVQAVRLDSDPETPEALENEPKVRQRSYASDQEVAGLDVLVVDDEPDARALLKRLLEDCGAKVRVAASVKAALSAIAAQKPDVVVSDIAMPDEDGYSLIRRIRALGEQEGGTIPALALTAHVRTEDQQRALDAGFNLHLPKPVEPSELIASVAQLGTRTKTT
jgi:signal transduction histidine kinase/CheY-like chemotaxis protein